MAKRESVDGAPQLAKVAGLLADGTRAAFCLALLDGRAWTAGELARHAGVAPATASEHLHQLVAGGLLAEQRQGRHRYLRLAGPAVAELIEQLVALAPHSAAPPAPRSLSAAGRQHALARGRTCYDHLAGSVGVAIFDAMAERGLLEQAGGLRLTGDGAAWLDELGVGVPSGGRRPAVLACVDWTERRPHLAGAVGAALCRHALAAGWVVRIGSTRAVAVTEGGRQVLRERLGVAATAI
ncbi:ArsR/SmtB family transcription factor [Kitasatospora sp. NBC_01266]|uniref:ArsR/SmtB family transcription factor n=1 Tax=Kitasatospora sp. NBC_01266 TaxID=2903572 RepID=UPI002E35128A|nr:winged helix-turn-helix domain-containing protein [Kitasatospora sp. NBC_01266]